MPIKTLLIPITDGERQMPSIDLGLALAKKLTCRATGLFLRPDPKELVPFSGGGLAGSVVDELCKAAEADGLRMAAAAKERFMARAQADGLKIVVEDLPCPGEACASWQEMTGLVTERIGRQARLADITVVPQPRAKADPETGDIVSDVMFRSGRPLIMAPEGGGPSSVDRALIAWNGGAEAARTVAASVSLISHASEVHAISVGEIHSDRPGLEGLATYLRHHGIESRLHQSDMKGRNTGKIILDEAKRLGCDLIVMGAYSHNRWREMVVGGVTRYSMANADIPIFMSH